MVRYLTVLVLLCLSSPVFARGERERILLAFSCAKWQQESQGIMPTTDPHLKLRNVPKDESPRSPTPLVPQERPIDPVLQPEPEPSYVEINAELTSQLAEQKAENSKLRDELEKKRPASSPATLPDEPAEQPELTLTAPALASSAEPPYPVYVAKASWCGGCRTFQSNNGDGNDDVRFVYVDIERQQPADVPNDVWKGLLYEAKHRTIPVCIWHNSNGEVVANRAARTTDELLRVIERNSPPSRIAVSASGVGGSINCGRQISQAIEKWRGFVGDGRELKFRLDKTGGALNLLKATTWTPQMAFGKFGHFQVSNLPSSVPLADSALGITYWLDDPRVPRFAVDKFGVDANRFANTLQGVNASAPEVQAYGFGDPVSTLSEIYALVTFIYAVTHPQCSLAIPGNVEWSIVLKGDALTVTFADPLPQVTVDVWFKWQLPLRSVVVTSQYVDVLFSRKGQERYLFPIDRRRIQVAGAYNAAAGSDDIPDEELAEGVDEFYGSASDDAHSDPRWRAFRRQYMQTHASRCQWKGCGNTGPGLNLHHCLPEKWVALAGHPELGYTEGHGQEFVLCCREHHELLHNIGHGGNWGIFNPDAKHDAEAGRWNSRGQSEWNFSSDKEAVRWVRKKISAAKDVVASEISEWVEAHLGYTTPDHLINVHGASVEEVDKYRGDQQMLNRIHGRYHGPSAKYTVAP